MDLFDFNHSIIKSLESIDKALHPKLENTFIDSFIHELNDYLIKKNSINFIEKLPSHTTLVTAKFDGDYIVCFDANKPDIYYLPKENIVGDMPEIGQPLHWESKGKYHIDSGGIWHENDVIDRFYQEGEVIK
jgi:hypothetical protein